MKTYTILSITFLFLLTSINTSTETIVDNWQYSKIDNVSQLDSLVNLNVSNYKKQINNSIRIIDSVEAEAKKLTIINNIKNYERENTFILRMYTPK